MYIRVLFGPRSWRRTSAADSLYVSTMFKTTIRPELIPLRKSAGQTLTGLAFSSQK